MFIYLNEINIILYILYYIIYIIFCSYYILANDENYFISIPDCYNNNHFQRTMTPPNCAWLLHEYSIPNLTDASYVTQ